MCPGNHPFILSLTDSDISFLFVYIPLEEYDAGLSSCRHPGFISQSLLRLDVNAPVVDGQTSTREVYRAETSEANKITMS